MYFVFKRIVDILTAIIALILLSPLILIICIAIKLESKGGVLFRQTRVGIHKSLFTILKFRTMRKDAPKDTPTHLLANPNGYITKVGGFLRKTSLDEIPQLWNILVGHMSFVGPRPALWNQHDLIEERDKYGANDVLPGLSGWAQINGRDTLTIEEKARLDGEYARKIGVRMDLKCFFCTILAVVSSRGVTEGGACATEHPADEKPHQREAHS